MSNHAGPAAGTGETLPVCRAAALEIREQQQRWLVEYLWAEQAVGILGGHPKIGKSWLGLDLAISIASGTPCLGCFAVSTPGPALVYLAEDALPLVRERIAGICSHRGLSLDALELYVITAADLQLDRERDQARLDATISDIQPRILLLDPLVRLHTRDENAAGEIAGLLGYLRRLQRTYGVAIVLVHHMAKKGRARLGNALRGSGDLFAFGDSYAYLTRVRDQIQLTLEHRSAPAPNPVIVELRSRDDGTATHLEVVAGQPEPASSAPELGQLVRAELRRAGQPLTRVALRKALRVNNNRLGDTLRALEADAHIERSTDGWLLTHDAQRDDDHQLGLL